MKKRFAERAVAALLAVVMCVGLATVLPVRAYAAQIITSPDGFVYYLTESDWYGAGAYIIDYQGSNTDIVVPATLGGENVIGIEMDDLQRQYYREDIPTAVTKKFTKLTSLNVTACTTLTFLACPNNELRTLDISQNTKLIGLNCSNNNLNELNISENIVLTELNCSNNNLISLDVSTNIYLWSLLCSDNYFSSQESIRGLRLANLEDAQHSGFVFEPQKDGSPLVYVTDRILGIFAQLSYADFEEGDVVGDTANLVRYKETLMRLLEGNAYEDYFKNAKEWLGKAEKTEKIVNIDTYEELLMFFAESPPFGASPAPEDLSIIKDIFREAKEWLSEVRSWTVIHAYNDKKIGNGFQATAFQKGNAIVVAFRGTQGSEWIDDWGLSNILGSATGMNWQLKEARDFIERVMADSQYSSNDIYITGHSLGGALAYDAAEEAFDIDSDRVKAVVTFNGLGKVLASPLISLLLGLGPLTLSLIRIPAELSSSFVDGNNYNKIKNYYVKGDLVGDTLEIRSDGFLTGWSSLLVTCISYGKNIPFAKNSNAKDTHAMYNFLTQLK
jgi:hypothetical protein